MTRRARKLGGALGVRRKLLYIVEALAATI
jgi:hypothetical protein